MDKKAQELLERIAVAVEQLAQDPVIEIEYAPPICPHCGQHSPTVVIEEGSEGSIAECMLLARCQSCNNTFIAVPQTWTMFTEMKAAEEEIRERAGTNGKH